MAFHQPTRQPTRVFRPTTVEDDPPQPQFNLPQHPEESQTWVLFSPASAASTTTSYLTPTHASNVTAGRSRVSDIGSFRTIAPSEASADHQLHPDVFLDVDAADEDDIELDSLDSHLPEFRSATDLYIASDDAPHLTPVVPAHDGLGSFRLEREGMGADVQNKLYAFEKYNPHRLTRRRESVERRIELGEEEADEYDKMLRIESWRLEQSRLLLGEIQKETRRRRRTAANLPPAHPTDQKAEDLAALDAMGGEAADVDSEWHEHTAGDTPEDRDSVWGRITRKVVRDLLGIDDKMLCILFGEALPDEEDLSTTPKVSVLPVLDSSWQLRTLERVAKELGLLVHRLSEHPGAFSTYTRMQQMPLPYAGLPAIPESGNNSVSEATSPPERSAALPEFPPTVPPPPRHASTPQAHQSSDSIRGDAQSQAGNGASFTQEEWEQGLDIRLVFRYLRSRFLSHPGSSTTPSSTPHLSPTGSPDVAAKAARVRQHHPLVSRSRNAPIERRISKGTAASSSALFRPVSSCASQSTRRSVRRSSSSSRHYWDIGGSVGTGSMIATTGPMGSWGEV
ncbi:hypothetical protein F5Y17DRAFT_448763 [Xylariaceae sp. FL0594]|nr:hypothetical protein F5Y17DRAFT_448763 [Xylariaceae sp. FL0594]